MHVLSATVGEFTHERLELQVIGAIQRQRIREGANLIEEIICPIADENPALVRDINRPPNADSTSRPVSVLIASTVSAGSGP